jgi:hypothetical protein
VNNQEECDEVNTLNEDIIQKNDSSPQRTDNQPPQDLREVSSHPLSNVIENLREGVRTWSSLN